MRKTLRQILETRTQLCDKLNEVLGRCKRSDTGGYLVSGDDNKTVETIKAKIDELNDALATYHGVSIGADGQMPEYDYRDPDGSVGALTQVVGNPLSPRYGGRESRASVLDLAIAGWCRNLHGVPIPAEEFRAATSLGFDPRGNAFAIPIPLSRPKLGRDLSFGGVETLGSQIVGSGPRGGYLVDGFMGKFEKALMASAPMLQVAEVIVTTDGRPLNWPSLDDTGAEGEQLGEGGAATADEITTFGSHMFSAHKLSSKIVKASHELVRDSAVALASEIGIIFGERLGRALNRRATTGSGAGTLKGFLESATVGYTAASTTAITFDELIQLQHSVDPAYRSTGKNVGFMMHSDTAGYVRRLKDGNGQHLWQNSTIAGQPPTLLGDPVYVNQMMASSLVASAKPVAYGDFSRYKIRIVGGNGTDGNGIRFRQLNELYAANDLIGFVSFLECDGILLTPSSTSSLCPVRVLQMAA